VSGRKRQADAELGEEILVTPTASEVPAEAAPVKTLTGHIVTEAWYGSFKRQLVSFDAGAVLKLKHYPITDIRQLRAAGAQLEERFLTEG
jgi:hypothetical protein